MQIKTEIFILQKYLYSESSFICHAFSPELGKIKFIIYGATKKQNNLSNYQIGSIVQVDIVKNNRSEWFKVYNSSLVTEITPKNYFTFFLLSFILEFLFKCEFDKNSFQIIFNKYKQFYLNIGTLDNKTFYYLLLFFSKIITLNGFYIRWNNCSNCGQVSYKSDSINGYIFRKESYSLNIKEATIRCSKCSGNSKCELTSKNIKLFFYLCIIENEVEDVVTKIPIEVIVTNLITLIKVYFYHYPVKLKSLNEYFFENLKKFHSESKNN